MPTDRPTIRGQHAVVIGLAVVCLLLAGCGFHLRGTDAAATWPAGMQQLQLRYEDSVDQDFRTRLRQQLVYRFGVELVSSSAPALVISTATHDRRVLSLSATGKVSEYLLRFDVSFSLLSREGKAIIENQTVLLRQAFNFKETDLLAIEVEQTRLQERMQNDAVRRILRIVIALTPNQ